MSNGRFADDARSSDAEGGGRGFGITARYALRGVDRRRHQHPYPGVRCRATLPRRPHSRWWRRLRIIGMQLPDESPRDQGKIIDHSAGIGEVSKAEIEQRARELAEIDGLDADQVNEGHRHQAREEMLGATDADAANDDEGAVADLISEDDVPGESGSAVITSNNSSADGDDQTIGEELVNEGIAESDHDRMTESRKQERLDQ